MIDLKHLQEWNSGSAVDPDLTALNVKTLSGNGPYDYLLYSPKLPRTNTGRLSAGFLKAYSHLSDGGWWCSGVNVLTGEDSLWGCFKPNSPRFDEDDKPIKYEHPPKVPTEIFALKIPAQTWQLISRRYSVDLPENYEQADHANFWKWVISNNLPIILCEGAKKAAAMLSCGYVAIGLPGVWSGIRQPKDEHGNYDGLASLIPQLQIFAQSKRRIYFCFDRDSKRNTVRSVNKSIEKTSKLFMIQGCSVNIITWHPLMGKGIDDVIVAFGREKFDELYCNAITFDEWQSHQLRQLTYTPDLTINERYLEEIVPPQSAQLICVKSAKGTYKTGWFSWLASPILSSGERRILMITHRVQLGLQSANRIGIPFISQAKQVEQGKSFGYGLCFDSLHPNSQAQFNPYDWTGAWVILDEIQQSLWHLLSSSTCQKDRVAIIKNFQKLLKHVVATGGKIFLIDADLNDISINFIEGLLGFTPERFILLNEYKADKNSWKVHRFPSKNPSQLVGTLEQRLKTGEKALLCVSGQRPSSKWSGQNLEKYFKRKLPELRILRIDSETVSDPTHPACGCTENLNQIIKDYDLVIASPTIETGVSIDEKHFDGVWGISQGVQTCDSVRQSLARERSPIPRYVWIKKVGLSFVGDRSVTPAKLISTQKQLDKANRTKLLNAGILELPDGNFSPICLEAWAKLGAIINAGMWRYEETILKDLQEEGHVIVDWDSSQTEETKVTVDVDTVKNEITLIRDENYSQYCKEVADSEKITASEHEKLSKQQLKTKQERLQEKKAGIEQIYGIECTAQLVEKNDKKFASKLKLSYYWDAGRKYLLPREIQLMESAIERGLGNYSITDTNRSLISLKIGVFDYLGINRLYKETGFHDNHPVIIDICEKIEKTKKDFTLVCGLDLSGLLKEGKRVRVVQRILELIGHKMICYYRKGKRKQEIRYYSSPAPEWQRDPESKKPILDSNGLPIPVLDERQDIFTVWLQRDAESLKKKEEQEAVALAVQEAQRKAEEEEEAAEAVRKAEEEAFKAEWLTQDSLQGIVELLEGCEDSEKVAGLRTCIPAFALKSACDLLPQEKRTIIKQWVREQNAAS